MSKPILMIGTPAYKRADLLFTNTFYTNKILKGFLESVGFEVQHVIVGSSDEEGNAVKHFDVEYHEIENFLSQKKNLILQLAQQRNVDYLFWLDSDDFIPTSLLIDTIDKATQNQWWASVENMYIYDLYHHRMVHFNGYESSHGLKNQGLGTCRIYTRNLLHRLPSDVFGYQKNKGMDGQIAPYLDKVPVLVKDRLIKTQPKDTLLGIKTSQNIWHLSDFQNNVLTEMNFDLRGDVFGWLDPEFVDLILDIDPLNP